MKQRTRWIFQVMAVLALTLMVLPVRYAMAQTMSEKKDLVDTAAAAGDFTTLVQALEAAGLTDTLQGDDTYTVFAPTDEAFAALPEGALDDLLADPEALKSVLLYHVVPGRLIAALINDGGEATTAQGEPVKFTFADGKKLVNDANITAKDIQAGNGVIHVVDKVLLPPSMGGATGPEAATEATPEAAAEATATAEATTTAAATVAATATETATPEATAEATPEATAEATPEATAEATPEATAEATPETTADAPTELPETGADASGFVSAVVVLALMGLAGAAFVSRRRTA